MTVIEHAGRLLVVDCGVLFPEDHQPGVDLILPDFEYIARPSRRHRRHRADPRARGPHRRGALPAAAQGRHPADRLPADPGPGRGEAARSTGSSPTPSPSRRGSASGSGVFDCEFIAVNHSIPDALAVAIRTPAGTLLHTGDFKMDQLPLDRRLTDLRAFARLGEEGVDLFLTDSTNAEVPGFTTPERDIAPAIDRVFQPARRRIIVACFSSHVHRVQQVLDAAATHGRKVAMVGRSMLRNMGIAEELGYLHVPPGVARRHQEAGRLPDDQVVLDLHRLPGRADGRPVADGQPRPPDRGRRGRHRAAGLLAHPRQRERRLPRHQRPDAPRRRRRAQGQRQGARLRARQRRRAPLLLQHRQAAQRDAGPRRVAAPASPTATSPSPPGCRATAWCSPRTAWWSTSSTAGPRSPARCRAATSTSTAPPSAAPPRRC